LALVVRLKDLESETLLLWPFEQAFKRGLDGISSSYDSGKPEVKLSAGLLSQPVWLCRAEEDGLKEEASSCVVM
jgi:hypothetical protein